MLTTEHNDRLKHLYSRASFGICYHELQQLSGTPVEKAFERLMEQSEKAAPLQEVTERLMRPPKESNPSEEEIKDYLRRRNEQEQQVNIGWMKRLAEAGCPFLEKMTLFWHGHFACRTNDGYYLQQLNNIHRKNALGNFRTMLLEVSQAPAMLSFLNNQQNKKAHPNENFARELMELFTLGRGYYTENDVKEAARAFTGWQYNRDSGEFFFNERQHDSGTKVFLGQKGSFSGEEIIDIILQKKQTAFFIAEKLYKFFVNDIPDPRHVEELGNLFYAGGYEMKPLLKKLFTADWFYHSRNVGNKIKSPVELLTGLNRQFNIRYENERILLQLQRSMGQALFYPPNVAGWPGGRSWIDSSSLLTRMKLPSLLLNGGTIESDGKADPEDEALISAMRKRQMNAERKIGSVPDWTGFFSDLPAGISKEELAYLLIAGKTDERLLSAINGDSTKNIVLQLLSTPEYQLC